MQRITHRDSLGEWLNSEMPLAVHGAEIGCAHGGYSRIVLRTWNGGRLFMVDPWSVQPGDVYREQQDTEDIYLERYRECVRIAIESWRATPLRMMSSQAAPLFPDAFFDWVYIDGNHSREAVTEDLNLWWPKVKTGGIFGGHDFMDKGDEGWHCYVKTAVTEWTAAQGLEFYTTPCPSWWIHK